MFKNKRKIDARIRYRSSTFSRKLESARGYKRVIRQKPKSPSEAFLAGIGLGSWQSRAITGAVFFLLIYLVYVPNFLFIKQVEVNGSNAETNDVVRNLTDSYLNKKLPWPQKNFLLLSKGGLKNYLLSNSEKVLSVDQITKKFPNRLTVNITPRLDSFLLETASSTAFTVSNDGLVTREAIPDASGTLPNLPFLIKLDSGDNLVVGQPALNNSNINFLNQLQSRLADVTKSPLDYYEMSDINSDSVTVYTKSGYKIIFDLTSDPDETLNRLAVLMGQFAPSDGNKLYYIDMRFKDRSYVCYKGTDCAQATIINAVTATTTP